MACDSTSEGTTETLIRFWGVRGSIPTPGPSTARYGGNTSCVEFRINGELIVIDAGSGIRGLGMALLGEAAGQPITLTLLNTHTHWDHIQGFPFFAPAFMKGNRIRVIGRDSAPDGLKGVFEKQMDGHRSFPVPLAALASDLSFEHIDENGGLDFQIGSIPVQAMLTNHPGGCLAYKFLTPQGSVIFLSDHETGGTDEPLVQEFIRDAVLLIADAQYSDEEIVSRRGWGHGCIKEVVDLSCRAGVKQLRLFHHDPTHGDDALDQLLVEAQDLVEKANSSMNVAFAREGETILLG
jgi:phosphoribosyl 1,2-cyclic phosphodiesterase